MRREKCRIVFATLSLLACVTGCTQKTEVNSSGGYYASAVSMESTPIVDYVVPIQTPNILVDFLGYQADGIKRAAVKGTELPEHFRLVDATSKEVVFEGDIEAAKEQTDSAALVGYAEFSDWTKEGEYYLECDRLGRSYTFPIVDTLYLQMFSDLVNEITNRCASQTAEMDEVTDLLTAYEWYPELFEDEDADEVPDVLSILADWTKNLEIDETESGVGVRQATVLVKFSYLYQKFDRKYATACLQRATAIYKQSQQTIHKDAESFFALTELYRATGQYTYRSQIEEYRTFFENNSSFLEEKEYLYGAMTYMVTRQKVNVDLCNIFMKQIKDRGEEVSGRYQGMIHPVSARNNGIDDILKRAREILFANYVLPSYQYNNILMECMHYLGGQNQEAVSFYDSEDNTGCLLALAQLASIPK
ncbi:MAG: glycoside hydrolase family 9 protein [Acetatifactor sp.]|nr:glycoside hydrolase family 9 protein [Acetatifactor sp.]